MTQYTIAQIENIWVANGGSRSTAAMAAAVAMAESGGSSTATNHNSNGSTDRGLWQINSTNAGSSTDVATNAKAAIRMSNNGSNWRPWCTAYSDGACGTQGGTYQGSGSPYQKFLTAARNAVSAITGKAPAGSTSGSTRTGSSGTSGTGGTGTTGTPAQATLTAAQQQNQQAASCDCLWKIGLGPLSGCVFTKCQARSWIGAAFIATGAIWTIAGLFLLIKATTGANPLGKVGQMAADMTAAGVSVFQPELAPALAGERAAAHRRATTGKTSRPQRRPARTQMTEAT